MASWGCSGTGDAGGLGGHPGEACFPVKALRLAAEFLALAAIITAAILFWRHVRDEFFVMLGSRNESGGWYGFNSGAGGAFYMSIIPATILLYWHHTCHVTGCLRPGRHTVDGTRWCNRHHIGARRRLADTGSAHDLSDGAGL